MGRGHTRLEVQNMSYRVNFATLADEWKQQCPIQGWQGHSFRQKPRGLKHATTERLLSKEKLYNIKMAC